MPTTLKGFIGAGFSYAVVFVKNADGAIIGSDATEPTAGSSIANTGLRIEGAMTIPVSIPDSDTVDVFGDDALLVQFGFGASGLPNGILELAVRNLFLEAMAQGTTVNQQGNIDQGVLMPEVTDLADLALLLGRRAKTWTPGQRGVERWELLFIPSCTLDPKGSADWTQRQHGPYRFHISISKGNITPWGETFYNAAQGTDAAALEPIETNLPYWVDVFKGDGVSLIFGLSKTPELTETVLVSEANILEPGANYALSAGPDRITYVGGQAPANDALIHVWYPVERNDL
ncbi:hypothetical protein KAR91_17865 [Candidatus Pacearchaeota archaeon]|nr:hypothetical protein [Candidatus Pacearchaeota archaeon]